MNITKRQYLCIVQIMKQRPKKELTATLKQYLQEMRDCLTQSVPGFDDKPVYNLRFSRMGPKYQIESAPVPPSDTIGEKLEDSFNKFMSNLKVSYDHIKLEGHVTIGTQLDTFIIGYDNYHWNGNEATKSNHSIEGII